MAEAHSPIEQFEITRLVELCIGGSDPAPDDGRFECAGGLDASFTNSSLWMLLTIFVIVAFLSFSTRGRALVPTRWQSMAELTYEFIAGMLRDTVGSGGRKYFPFIFSLFMFVLFANLLGLVPFAFTVTSHIIVTFAMALVIFTAVTVIGFAKNGIGFLKFFAPSGVPWWVMPILVPIEVISYFVRPISLSVRLFANMMAGHTMLKVFGGFVVALGLIGGWAPLAFIVVFTGFEIGVAIIQAYIFAILTCLYLNDALHPHH